MDYLTTIPGTKVTWYTDGTVEFSGPGSYHKVMTDTPEPYDFGAFEASVVERLVAQKIQPVPSAIVRHAQRSLDGVPHPKDPSKTMHVLSHEFPTPELAAEFAKHMRHAGNHTNPLSTVSVAIDPDNPDRGGTPVNPCKVAWRAGARKGAKAVDKEAGEAVAS